jgi:hypothetical protein
MMAALRPAGWVVAGRVFFFHLGRRLNYYFECIERMKKTAVKVQGDFFLKGHR